MRGSFRYFRNKNSGSRAKSSEEEENSDSYKYSAYLQSRDSKWLNRNLSTSRTDDENDPREDDLED